MRRSGGGLKVMTIVCLVVLLSETPCRAATQRECVGRFLRSPLARVTLVIGLFSGGLAIGDALFFPRPTETKGVRPEPKLEEKRRDALLIPIFVSPS